MATVKSPLMSLDASGHVAHAIVFTKWKGRNVVRKNVKPSNPKSAGQVSARAAAKFNSQQYKNVGVTAQNNWKAQYKSRNISGINSMNKLNNHAIRQGTGPKKDPTNAAGAVEAAPTGAAVTASYKTLTVTWVDSAGANDWATIVYASKTGGFTPGPGNIVAIVAHGVQTFTHFPLHTGDTWYYRLAGVETGGTIGTLAAQVNGNVG
jgi:hypothetical protein